MSVFKPRQPTRRDPAEPGREPARLRRGRLSLAPFAPARLSRTFFDRHTVTVARELIGKLLVRTGPDGYARVFRIVETEAYHGVSDRASHAHRGPTARNRPMFGAPGFAYVYQVYGVWFCLNAVTGRAGFPGAVLVRACVPARAQGLEDARVAAGPGKLCRWLAIDKALNGCDLVDGDALWIGKDELGVLRASVSSGPRIGVDYAGACAERPWRFWITQHPSVSRLGATK